MRGPTSAKPPTASAAPMWTTPSSSSVSGAGAEQASPALGQHRESWLPRSCQWLQVCFANHSLTSTLSWPLAVLEDCQSWLCCCASSAAAGCKADKIAECQRLHINRNDAIATGVQITMNSTQERLCDKGRSHWSLCLLLEQDSSQNKCWSTHVKMHSGEICVLSSCKAWCLQE